MTVSSIWLGPLELNHVHWLIVHAAAMKSASTLGQVGATATNPKNRGWSCCAANGRMSRATWSMTSPACRPSSGGGLWNCSASTCWNSPSQEGPSRRFPARSTSSSTTRRALARISSGDIRRSPVRTGS